MSVSPHSVVYDAKRLIGRGFDDPNIKKSIDKWPFKVVRWDMQNNCQSFKEQDANVVDNIRILIDKDGKEYPCAPVEISAHILSYLKECAQRSMQCEIDTAVITVPAHFNDNQRDKTKVAATIAGFKNVRLLNEPTAAAMAYGYGRSKADGSKKETTLIFDLGGGTFDVSILAFEPATEEGAIAEVLGTDGDTFLGGVDFDNCLIEYCVKMWMSKGNRAALNEKQRRRLRTACEKAKRNLSTSNMTTIDIECFAGEENFSLNISRAVFENLCAQLFKKCIDRVKGCLLTKGKGDPIYDKEGNLLNTTANETNIINTQKNTIDKVILVGGSSRIPKVREMLGQFFDESKLCYSIHPDEAIALGAAYQAAMLAGDADLQAKDTILLLDTTPMDIRIETAGGVGTVLIEKNSTIPVTQAQTFTTYSDNQPAVTINIFEGNRPMVKDNHLIGTFTLTGIPPAPRGVPQIEITCAIDNNGILVVTAKDKATSKSESLSITNTAGRLSEDEIQRMVEEAKKYEEADKLIVEKVNARNNLESQVYTVLNLVKDAKVEEYVKENITNEVNEIKNWLDVNPEASKEEYEEKNAKLREIISKVSGAGMGPNMGGQDSNMGGQGHQGNEGPSVEEVD